MNITHEGLTIREVVLCVLMAACLFLAVLATAWFISETNDQPVIGRDLRDRE
jgi:hypothetical protein